MAKYRIHSNKWSNKRVRVIKMSVKLIKLIHTSNCCVMWRFLRVWTIFTSEIIKIRKKYPECIQHTTVIIHMKTFWLEIILTWSTNRGIVQVIFYGYQMKYDIIYCCIFQLYVILNNNPSNDTSYLHNAL